MLFIQSLPETTRGEDIFNHIMKTGIAMIKVFH